jgi:hypothetical protein
MTRIVSRTEEVRGSNPLTSTPTKPWSPAWRVASTGPAPFQVPLPGSKRAATANETANRYSIAAKRRCEADTYHLPITRRMVGVDLDGSRRI